MHSLTEHAWMCQLQTLRYLYHKLQPWSNHKVYPVQCLMCAASSGSDNIIQTFVRRVEPTCQWRPWWSLTVSHQKISKGPWGICWSNITSPQKLQKLCSWWNDTKAILFSFSQDIQHNSIQRSCMNHIIFQSSLKSRHCRRRNHFVANIILALYRST